MSMPDNTVPADVEGLSMLQHFDYPETWSCNGNAEFSDSAKFGKGCVYFPDATSSVSVTNTTGMFNLHPEANYEFEAFVKLDGTVADANILSLGGLALAQKRAEREVVDTTVDLAAQGYYFYGGHTFKYYSNALTWANAKTACENLGGHLATSTSAGKNTFLKGLIPSSTTWAFLGGTDEAKEGTWKWVTGETWRYTKWEGSEPNNSGGVEDYLILRNTDGIWWDTGEGPTPYICEWDVDIRNTTKLHTILGLTTTEPYSVLGLASADWGIDSTTITEITPNVWHHLLLRISGGYVTLFIDGTQALREAITGSDILKPETVALGGYVGYMDEFVSRRNAGSGVPEVPAYAYGTEFVEVPVEVPSAVSNAPVSRAAWSCENLPDGLTLSSAGILSGHPTTAGTYECEFSVATNWGTATKTVRIVVA